MAREECENPNCFTNMPDSIFICDECLNELLINELTMDEVYELYLATDELLSDSTMFESFVKLAAESEERSAEDEEVKKNVEEFKNNLFDIFNQIMQEKLEVNSE